MVRVEAMHPECPLQSEQRPSDAAMQAKGCESADGQPVKRQPLGGDGLVSEIEMPDRQMPVLDDKLLAAPPVAPRHSQSQSQDQETVIEDEENSAQPEACGKQQGRQPLAA